MNPPKVRSLKDFKSVHDKSVVIPAKIRAALAQMAELGPEHYEYELDFLKLAGLSVTDLAVHREQFAEHVVHVKHANGKAYSTAKNVWFATKAAATKARGA